MRWDTDTAGRYAATLEQSPPRGSSARRQWHCSGVTPLCPGTSSSAVPVRHLETRISRDLVGGRAVAVSRGGWTSPSSALLWVRWSSACGTNARGLSRQRFVSPRASLGKCRASCHLLQVRVGGEEE